MWAIDQYEHALKVMQDMALVMECSPEAFKFMDEEALRQHFLVQLNGQFEGRASGETFNMAGKTDIPLREGDRNVFIAGCKFWKGPKAYGEVIDQLQSYATWRDGKAAILVFNRGTDTSTVLKGIDAAKRAHKKFKRAVDWPHESGFRYILHINEDRIAPETVRMLEPTDLVQLPKGEAFALIHGGQLHKIRMPLPSASSDPLMPASLAASGETLRAPRRALESAGGPLRTGGSTCRLGMRPSTTARWPGCC